MKLRAVTVALLLGATSLTLIAGCSRERIDWKSAEAADTVEGYDHFLERHPDGELATQARSRIAQLAEDKDWQRAIASDTADAYRSFLAQHANGKWAEEARIRMENFTLDANAAPATDATEKKPLASTAPAPAAIPGEAATRAHPLAAARSEGPPPGPPSKPAPVAPAASAASTSAAPEHADTSGYGIQLGAFSSQQAALTEWKRIQQKFDPQLHGMFARAVPVTVTSGTLFRLQSPVDDESKARSICSELTKQQQPCVVVLPQKH